MARPRLSEDARKFLREVGSIVLGVLIALGIGEIADTVRWQSRAADSNRAMDVELARAAGVLDERVQVQPCLDRRLNALAAIVRTARRTGALPDIRNVGGPPLRPLQTAAWDDAVASGTLLHLGVERRSTLSVNYPLLKNYPGEVIQELGGWSSLRMLEAVPGPASDMLLTDAAAMIGRLQSGSRLSGLSARQIRDNIVATGIRPSYYLILDREGSRHDAMQNIVTRCRTSLLDPAGARQEGGGLRR